ncbi:MAG TPA: pyridoxal phosphate-dependent aminotransferase family protein [Longimicrobium sp.]|jgi:glycine C-acetyltransferase
MESVSTAAVQPDRWLDEVEAPAPPRATEHDLNSFYYSSSDDVLAVLTPYNEWYDEVRPTGYFLLGQPMAAAPKPHVEVQEPIGKRRLQLLNLSSYNYLGLSYRQEVIDAAKNALDRYGLGAAGSPILSGTMEVHEELQNEIARFKGTEAAVIYPSGYSTNVGLISGLMRAGDVVIMDQNAHASCVDGAILSKADTRFFRHNQPENLEKQLKKVAGKKVLVVVEGVYSMDGDVCPLPEILEVTKRYGARIMIDEAHSSFIYGPSGGGVVDQFGLKDEIDIHLGTFSKALGGMGGYVACSLQMKRYLDAFSRSRFFSCALSPVITAGVLEALRIVQREPELRERLWANVAHMRGLLAEHGVDVGESTSQIIPVMVRDDRRVMGIGRRMQESGLYVQPVKYPAVTKNRSRFRISISAAHEFAQLERASEILVSVLRQEGILK